MSEALEAANNAVFWASVSVAFACLSIFCAGLSIWFKSREK